MEGATPRRRPRITARLARKLEVTRSEWKTGCGCGWAWWAARFVATPLPRGAGVLTSMVRADGLLVVPAGQEGHHPGEPRRGRAAARHRRDLFRTIVAIGSHDLVLDLAASALRAEDPLITLASSNVAPGGLVALRDGLCHTSPGPTCWIRRPASTRCPISTGSCPGPAPAWSGSCTATRA